MSPQKIKTFQPRVFKAKNARRMNEIKLDWRNNKVQKKQLSSVRALGLIRQTSNRIIGMLLLLMALTFEFFTLNISVRLSDRFKVTQNKINFVKNCPQWSLNS